MIRINTRHQLRPAAGGRDQSFGGREPSRNERIEFESPRAVLGGGAVVTTQRDGEASIAGDPHRVGVGSHGFPNSWGEAGGQLTGRNHRFHERVDPQRGDKGEACLGSASGLLRGEKDSVLEGDRRCARAATVVSGLNREVNGLAAPRMDHDPGARTRRQGGRAAHFSGREMGLEPGTCGRCHPGGGHQFDPLRTAFEHGGDRVLKTASLVGRGSIDERVCDLEARSRCAVKLGSCIDGEPARVAGACKSSQERALEPLGNEFVGAGGREAIPVAFVERLPPGMQVRVHEARHQPQAGAVKLRSAKPRGSRGLEKTTVRPTHASGCREFGHAAPRRVLPDANVAHALYRPLMVHNFTITRPLRMDHASPSSVNHEGRGSLSMSKVHLTPVTSNAQPQAPRSTAILQVVRALFHLATVVIITVWGFVSWPLPFPGIITGVGFLALTVVIWALFLSPKPMLRTDRFGQALVELLLLAAAVAALLFFGIFWVWPMVFGVAGAVVGYLASARK